MTIAAEPLFRRRGIVLIPADLSYERWPELAAESGLNVIALHAQSRPLSRLAEFLRTEVGERFLSHAGELGLDVEYELHAMADLLPRERFGRHPEMFRMDEAGERVPDANLCVSSPEALEVISQRSAVVAGQLTPTTHRYFLWADDGRPWCQCPPCRELSPSDQNLTAMVAILGGLRTTDPQATLAALAYHDTLDPPTKVKPVEGLFLEYAPISRSWQVPLSDPSSEVNREHVERLRRLIEFFGPRESQVLEYWLDASRHSNWQRPAQKLPVTPEVMAADAEFYHSLGFEHATTFGVFLDAEYFERYGVPPVVEYGRALRSGRATSG